LLKLQLDIVFTKQNLATEGLRGKKEGGEGGRVVGDCPDENSSGTEKKNLRGN